MSQPMESPDHSHLTAVEARQGIMTGRMRYVLGISLSLAIASLFIVFAFFWR